MHPFQVLVLLHTIIYQTMSGTMDQIEQRILQIEHDREHGSRWLVKEAVTLLREIAAQEQPEPEKQIAQLRNYACRIALARPAMAALSSAMGCVLHADGLSAIVQEADQLLVAYEHAPEQIASYLQPLIQGHIMTCSLSGTVLAVLRSLRQQLQQITVLEGRPGYEGREVARILGEQGIAVNLITDAQADIFLPRCQVVIVGADSVLVNGDVINKAGTALLAWAARGRSIPFYVLSETLKISPQRWIEHEAEAQARNWRMLEEKEAGEVWEQAPPGVRVHNFYFDRTPYRLITSIVTEQGILNRQDIREIAIQTRNNIRELLRSAPG